MGPSFLQGSASVAFEVLKLSFHCEALSNLQMQSVWSVYAGHLERGRESRCALISQAWLRQFLFPPSPLIRMFVEYVHACVIVVYNHDNISQTP